MLTWTPIAPLRSTEIDSRLKPASFSGRNGLIASGARASTWLPPPSMVPSIALAASACALASPLRLAASIFLPCFSICWPSAASLPSALSLSIETLLPLSPILTALPTAAPMVPAAVMPPTIMPRMMLSTNPIRIVTIV